MMMYYSVYTPHSFIYGVWTYEIFKSTKLGWYRIVFSLSTNWQNAKANVNKALLQYSSPCWVYTWCRIRHPISQSLNSAFSFSHLSHSNHENRRPCRTSFMENICCQWCMRVDCQGKCFVDYIVDNSPVDTSLPKRFSTTRLLLCMIHYGGSGIAILIWYNFLFHWIILEVYCFLHIAL